MPSSGVQTCALRSEEHTSELQSHSHLVCRLLLEKTKHGAHLAYSGRITQADLTSHTHARPCRLRPSVLVRQRPPHETPSRGLPLLFFFKATAPPPISPLSPPPPLPR